jgi:hypothetical protein
MLLYVFPMSILIISVSIEVVGWEGIDLIVEKMVVIRPVETMKLDRLNSLDRLSRPYSGHPGRTVHNTQEDIIFDGDQA